MFRSQNINLTMCEMHIRKTYKVSQKDNFFLSNTNFISYKCRKVLQYLVYIIQKSCTQRKDVLVS